MHMRGLPVLALFLSLGVLECVELNANSSFMATWPVGSCCTSIFKELLIFVFDLVEC